MPKVSWFFKISSLSVLALILAVASLGAGGSTVDAFATLAASAAATGAATAAALAPLEVCYTPAQISEVRVIHASPNSPAVDVYLDKATTAAISKLAYGSADAAGYIALAAGVHQVKVTAAGDAKTVVFDKPVTVVAQTAYSLVAEGTLAEKNFTVTAYVDDVSATAGQARVEVIHSVSDAGPVDVLSAGKVVVAKLAFGKSATLSLDPGSYDLAVTATGDATKVLIPLAATKLEADKIYTVVAIGLAGSNKADKNAPAITSAIFVSKSIAGFAAPATPTPAATKAATTVATTAATKAATTAATTAATKVATIAATKTVAPVATKPPVAPTATPVEKGQKPATAGVTPVNTKPKTAARHLSDGSSCVQVRAVNVGGPAAVAGLKATDLILGVDGAPVKDAAAFLAAIDKHLSGDKVVFDVQHAGTLTITKVPVTLGLLSF